MIVDILWDIIADLFKNLSDVIADVCAKLLHCPLEPRGVVSAANLHQRKSGTIHLNYPRHLHYTDHARYTDQT